MLAKAVIELSQPKAPEPAYYMYKYFKGTFLSPVVFLISFQVHAQQLPHPDSVKQLITNTAVMLEINSGIDDMYNFEFSRAASQFRWLQRNYPKHPLPYFLLGLNEWWKIQPNTQVTLYDNALHVYLDSAIYLAEEIEDEKKDDPEAVFFLAAAWGFKGRVYSERENWTKAAFAGKRALGYMNDAEVEGDENLGPEFLVGEGLYNYFTNWIRDNYKALRTVMWLFPKGDKELGIEQLKTVSEEAFYSRIEGMLFLMKIYQYENQPLQALRLGEYLHGKYPQNPYFHRYYTRLLYENGRYAEMAKLGEQILSRIDSGQVGYEAVSGRYASFFLGTYERTFRQNIDTARNYFERTVRFAEESESYESGYYLHALRNLAEIAVAEERELDAYHWYGKIVEHADKKERIYDEAKDYYKSYKREHRKELRD